jgi:hypothetical protein
VYGSKCLLKGWQLFHRLAGRGVSPCWLLLAMAQMAMASPLQVRVSKLTTATLHECLLASI